MKPKQALQGERAPWISLARIYLLKYVLSLAVSVTQKILIMKPPDNDTLKSTSPLHSANKSQFSVRSNQSVPLNLPPGLGLLLVEDADSASEGGPLLATCCGTQEPSKWMTGA